MAWFSEILPDVIRYFRGDPTHVRADEMRWGNHGSLSCSRRNGQWVYFDHEGAVGGGAIDFVSTELNMPKSAATLWIQRQFKAKPPALPDAPAPIAPAAQKPVAPASTRSWDYVSADGEVTLRVYRRDDGQGGKKYWQKRIVDGAEQANAEGWTPIPYRLPEILKFKAKTVFVAEGEQAADALAGLGLVATTNARGAKKWQNEICQYLRDRDVVILPDNDRAGREHAADVSRRLWRVARTIRVVDLPGLPVKGDAADWIAAGGTKADLVALVRAAEPITGPLDAPPEAEAEALQGPDAAANDAAAAQPGRVQLVRWDEIEDVPVRWLVDGVLPAEGFCVLYGRPGAYKSFVSLYLAAMIAAGRDAFGLQVEQGEVVYLMGEGGAGLRARLDAAQATHDLPRGMPVHFIRQQLNLRSTMDDANALVAAVQALGIAPRLLVIDTLARAFAAGNENASEDMGAFIRCVGEVQAALGCAVLLVHHSGKDETKGMRGHSSLFGAADAELEVVKTSAEDSEQRSGRLKVTKQKDGEDGIEHAYRMAVAPTRKGETSLAVVPMTEDETAAIETATRRRAGVPRSQKLAFDALRRALQDYAEKTATPGVPDDRPVCKESYWRHVFYTMSPGEQDAKKKAFQRASAALCASGSAHVWGGFVWVQDHS